MKRTMLLFCTAILLICFLCGCVALPGENTSYPNGSKIPDDSSVKEPDDVKAEDAALTALQKRINQSGSVVGIAFIGYVDSGTSEVDLRTYLQAAKREKNIPVSRTQYFA